MKKSDFIVTVESVRVDTISPFVQLVAETPAAYKEIDAIYAKESSRYYRAASKSPYYNHPSFISGGIERELYARRYLGLLLAAIDEGLNSTLFAKVYGIMAKRWDSLHNHIKNCKEIDIESIIAIARQSPFHSSQPVNNRISEVTNHFLASLVTNCSALERTSQSALRFALFTTCIHGCKVASQNKKLLTELKFLNEASPIHSEFQSLKRRLNAPDVKKIARDLKNSVIQQIHSGQNSPWSNDRLVEGWAHCWSLILAEEGLPFLQHDFRTLPKDRDVELLCRIFFIKITADWLRHDQVSETFEDLVMECTEFVMRGWICFQVLREYKKVRRYYSDHNADRIENEIKIQQEKNLTLEEQLRRTKDELAAQTYFADLKKREISEINRRYKRELESLQIEIERLNGIVRSSAQAAAETKIFDETEEENMELFPKDFNMSDTSNDLKKLQEVQAIVIGGTEKWQTKLCSHLPHFVYLYGDAEGFDETLVINSDIVFADVRFKFSHNCYYRLTDILRRHNKKLVFLSKTNIPLTVHQMANAIS